jgi:hypothetical protein
VRGLRRTIAVEVPFFMAAIRCLVWTDLIAIVPRRLAELERGNRAVKFVLPPKEMKRFRHQSLSE